MFIARSFMFSAFTVLLWFSQTRPVKSGPLLSDDEQRELEDDKTNTEDSRGTADLIGPVVRLNDVLFSGNVLRETSHPVGHWIVLFCPSWWGPCQQAMTDFSDLGESWQTKLNTDALLTLSARFARVDCATDKVLCNKMEVADYPTIKHYSNGVHIATLQGKSRASITKWLAAQLSTVQPADGSSQLQLAPELASAYLCPGKYTADLLVACFMAALNFWVVSRNPDLWRKDPASSVSEDDHVSCVSESSTVDSLQAQSLTGIDRMLPQDWLCQRTSMNVEI
eukprot:TRINITY_DN569_c0_g1_i1.p1 TRINITY_DN569_c0_g1~~TRINITY_DN569_c0_g1_i1.p1  ORF type:complete len:309 (+),score=30.63 TRINITY_DN569_c0_g1_i1:87-929(+)